MSDFPTCSYKEKYTSASGKKYNIQYYLLTNYASVNIDSEILSLINSTLHIIKFDTDKSSFIHRVGLEDHHSNDNDLMSHMNETYQALLKTKAFL